jgi:hypothetical protein
MNTAPGRYPNPPLKASDADREAVVTALSEHFQAGRLTTEELDERTGRALAGRTLDDLAELTADLPARPLARPASAGKPAQREHRGLAPAVVAFAGVALVALVLGAAWGQHGWHHSLDIWWVIPVALLIARRVAGRGRAFPGSRRS